MIKAPFNFVPLSEKVFFPDWADRISHDVPFEDGMSGVIDIELKAITPMFVRNGHTKEQAENKAPEYVTFSKSPDGRYFIPSTTIKGAIRNALEILSFGKMSRITDKRYSIRDLKLKKEYLEKFSADKIHCGWMRLEGEKVIIEDHGLPYRISHFDIDLEYDTDFCNKYEGESGKRFLGEKEEDRKTARHKYKLFHGKSLQSRFEDIGKCTSAPVDKRLKAAFSKDGWEGTIVFTGQPGERKPKEGSKKASGKFYEFVFKKDVVRNYTLEKNQEKGLYEDFCFIYKDSEDWAFWKENLDKGGSVPIFMLIEKEELMHFGLSYLYKLPTAKRIKDYLYPEHKKQSLDLAECIFGTTENVSLKGRVTFSHAYVKGHLDEENLVYMGTPKPTYYPIYLKQEGEGGIMERNGKVQDYKTLLSDDAELKGWKMYPIRTDVISQFDIPEGQEENSNPFQPIAANSIFKGKVIFHNLRKFELASLVYALELKNDSLHSIGFAKPFGYGATRITIKNIKGCDLSVDELRGFYEAEMETIIPNYKKAPSIREFFSMAKSRPLKTGYTLKYMDLDEFVEAKAQHQKKDKNYNPGEYLPYYSEMVDYSSSKKTNLLVSSIATVTYATGSLKKAKLIEGKDTASKVLKVEDRKIKLKEGDTIEVEKFMKGGNIQYLIYKGKH